MAIKITTSLIMAMKITTDMKVISLIITTATTHITTIKNTKLTENGILRDSKSILTCTGRNGYTITSAQKTLQMILILVTILIGIWTSFMVRQIHFSRS